ALLGDLVVGLGYPFLMPGTHHEKHDVVVRKRGDIGVDAEEFRLTRDRDPDLFLQLAAERHPDRLAALDAAPREAPARLVGVANEKDAAIRIYDRSLRADRQPAGQPP